MKINPTTQQQVRDLTKRFLRPGRVALTNARRKAPFVNNIYYDCTEAANAFSTARGAARAAQNGQIVSTLKGIGQFAKKVGPIPFTTTALGFLTFIPGSATLGLITGVVAKNGAKEISKLLKFLKK